MDAPNTDTRQDEASALRQALVDQLVQKGHVRSQQVEAAFRAVPRHLFVPDVPLSTVYSDTHIVTKTVDGHAVSSSSQPTVMAIMLEQLDLHAGQRVLEIGAGTGYNAALLAHIVGERGQVVTIDIDGDIIAAAQAHLAAAGYTHVRAICGDGGTGYLSAAPYDRIIVTVGADDLPPAWREQLRPGGRLVVPLGLMRLDTVLGTKALVTFDRVGRHLESRSLSFCAFVALRGAFEVPPATSVALGPTSQIDLITDGPVDADQLYAVLISSHRDAAVGITVTPRALFGLRLWLALHECQVCDLSARGACAAQGLVPFLYGQPGSFVATIGLCTTSTMALLAYEPGQEPAVEEPDPDRARLLVTRTYGPDDAVARRLAAQVSAWEQAGRPFSFNEHGTIDGPRLRVYARDEPYAPSRDEALIEQPSARLVFNWGA